MGFIIEGAYGMAIGELPFGQKEPPVPLKPPEFNTGLNAAAALIDVNDVEVIRGGSARELAFSWV